MDVDGREPEETVTKRAVEGTLGILRACLNSKRVKRVIYISSAATILYNNEGLSETDESTWSNLDICRSSKLVSPSYLLSKTITERTALEFAEKNGLDLVTLVLPLVVGSFLCPTIPSSVSIALAMIFGIYIYILFLIMLYILSILFSFLRFLKSSNIYVGTTNVHVLHTVDICKCKYPQFVDVDSH